MGSLPQADGGEAQQPPRPREQTERQSDGSTAPPEVSRW